MLTVADLLFHYKSIDFQLGPLNFSLEAGQFTVLAGKNGSGKTTTTRLIMSLEKPDGGEILFQGKNITFAKTADKARHIGYVFQNPDLIFYQNTAWDEVSYGPRQLKFSPDKVKAVTEAAFAALELTGKEQQNPKLMTKGEKQRLAIACAVALQPDLLILDEPTCGQDMVFRTHLMELLKNFCRQGKAVLVITHDRMVLEKYADRVIVIQGGSLVFDGEPLELFRHNQALEWGLTLPVAAVLSQKLQEFGVVRTASLEELAQSIRAIRGNP
ncbi:MAG: ABC transporter ATP-binding protein [Sporomusaceae bacterium]|nr:ABC transporter ATP-binding protein [Sporomusaceae bacterium]